MYNFVGNKEIWNRFAQEDNVYSRICNGFTEQKFRTKPMTFLNFIHFPKPIVVLDLGCGIGRIVRFIQNKCSKYIGVDFSEIMIEKAKLYNQEFSFAEFICSDTLRGFSNIDCVNCEQVFIHTTKEDTIRYLLEVKDILKVGGVFCFNIPSKNHYVNGFIVPEVIDILRDMQVIQLSVSDIVYYFVATKN